MNVLDISGRAGSGKTTLLVALLPRLRGFGLSVSVLTRAPRGFDMDRPGKDSHRHRQAGAREVLVASSKRWALLHENGGTQPELAALLAQINPVDLALVEGFPIHPYPRLEVFRPSLGLAPLWPWEPRVVAIASDSTPDIGDRILLPLNDPDAIATWIRSRVVARG